MLRMSTKRFKSFKELPRMSLSPSTRRPTSFCVMRSLMDSKFMRELSNFFQMFTKRSSSVSVSWKLPSDSRLAMVAISISKKLMCTSKFRNDVVKYKVSVEGDVG